MRSRRSRCGLGPPIFEVAGPVGRDQAEQTLDHGKLKRLLSIDRGRFGNDGKGAVQISRAEERSSRHK